MGEMINYISKVEINGLWNKFDIEWNLSRDVNVLSGINGSGKSTILKCVFMVMMDIAPSNTFWADIDEIGEYVRGCKISFKNGYSVFYRFVKTNDKIQNEKIEEEFNENGNINKHTGIYYGVKFNVYILGDVGTLEINQLFQINSISTFDTPLVESEAAKKLSDNTVKTELDWEIYHLQKKYIEYKLNTAKKTIDAISKPDLSIEAAKILVTLNRFLDIIDALFLQTGKRINKDENEISFLIGTEKISPYQLSSGEKQILVILLTVLVQDNKKAILFMDEPEISLHFDWQKKLIQYIRELNPNVQIILATHSPAVIMEGWMDKVSEVSDLIKSNTKSELNVR